MEKVLELDEEKKKTEKAFHDFLPPSVVRDLKNNKVEWNIFYNFQLMIIISYTIQQTAEHFECVTIFFGDIIGFNVLSADCSAVEVESLIIFRFIFIFMFLADRFHECVLWCIGHEICQVQSVQCSQYG